MPWYKNDKPSALGLAHKGEGPPRVVQPGEVFEATAEEIPEAWKTAGFVSDAKQPPAPGKEGPAEPPPNPNADPHPNLAKGKPPPSAQVVPDVASEEAPTDKEVADADKNREKSGLFGGKHK